MSASNLGGGARTGTLPKPSQSQFQSNSKRTRRVGLGRLWRSKIYGRQALPPRGHQIEIQAQCQQQSGTRSDRLRRQLQLRLGIQSCCCCCCCWMALSSRKIHINNASIAPSAPPIPSVPFLPFSASLFLRMAGATQSALLSTRSTCCCSRSRSQCCHNVACHLFGISSGALWTEAAATGIATCPKVDFGRFCLHLAER